MSSHCQPCWQIPVPALLLLTFAALLGSDAALTDFVSGVAPYLGAEADWKAQYLARHEIYPVDVRDYRVYHRIVGEAGQSFTRTEQDARNLSECHQLPQDKSRPLPEMVNGSW